MQLYTAQLDAWNLAILDISDSIQKSIVKHEYINTDGADCQDIGARARSIRFRAYFFGDSHQVQLAGTTTGVNGIAPTYLEHFDFINYLAMSEVEKHILVHPKYGVIEGYVEGFTITHDDTIDYCAIDIDFVENGIKNEEIFPITNTINLQVQNIKQLNSVLGNAGNVIKNTLKCGSILGQPLNDAIKKSQQISATVNVATRTFVNEIDDNIQAFNSFLSIVPNVADSVDNAVSWASDIPTAIIRPINNAINRIYKSLENISNTPLTFVNNTLIQLEALKNVVIGTNANFFKMQVMSVGAGSLMAKAAKLLSDDQQNSNTTEKPGFDMNGIRIGPSIIKIMTRGDIEMMIQKIQIYVQSVILLNRNDIYLKQMMANMNAYVNYIKLHRLIVQEIQVNNQPLHCLLMALGQSYQLADNYIAMNSIRNPSFVEGTIKVYTTV